MDKYTKLVLTVIAAGLIAINIQLFKDDLITNAHAVESHNHGAYEIYDLKSVIENCSVSEGAFNTYKDTTFGNTYDIDC
jgi:hypothetical protein